jgi:hypothetical protein
VRKAATYDQASRHCNETASPLIKERIVKYILMMNTPRGGDYQIMSWPKKDI